MFADNAAGAGNRELNNIFGGGGINLTVQFSQTVNPFQPGTLPAEYVRVRATGFTLPAWLIRVLGIDEKTVSASAVSGPSPTILNACTLVPLIICGDPGAGAPFWGYQDDQVEVLKGGANPNGCNGDPIGPGNFQLARLDGSGANIVRDNLAGGYEGCFSDDDTVPTEPGNEVGPVAQGINTRFNTYTGPIDPADNPPDVVIQQASPPLNLDVDPDTCARTVTQGGTVINSSADIDFNYDDYLNRVAAPNYDIAPPTGAFDRRTLPVFIADCSGVNNGQTDLPILGFGCFHLLQEVVQKGNEAEIYGEFVDSCAAQGTSGPEPTTIPGPYIIQLYHDSDSIDS
jgi:hypothetical protein